MKRFFKLNFFLNFLTLFTFACLLIDSVFYYGFSQKHFYINSRSLLLFYIIIALFAIKKITISQFLIKLNKILFPIIVLSCAISLYLEKSNYPNFVYGHIHINPFNFIYLPIISGFVLYINSHKLFFKTIIFIIIPIIATYLSQSLSFSQNINFYLPFKTIIINLILWLAVFFLFFSLFQKKYQSLIALSCFFSIFNLLNRYKIRLWDNYFVVSDIYLTKNIKEFFLPTINGINLTKELIIFLFLFIILIIFLKNKVKAQNPSFKLRLFLLLISIFILSFPITFPSQYKNILQRFRIETYIPNPILNCQANGILFCFYDDFKNLSNPPPANYSQSTIQNIFSEIKSDSSFKEVIKSDDINGVKPNIIVILSEAFWDLNNLTNVKFSQDPIKNVRQDIKSTFVSPSFGGGTANVEFEVITGLSNYFLHGKTPYGQTIKKPIPSLFTSFKDKGYFTTTIHPFLGSMYNRKTIYKNFGLDKFISIEDMSNYEKPNPYISDEFLNQEILKQLNSSNQPQFIFALSMQNHVVFEANRYTQHPISFQSPLNSYEQPILQSYVDGINLTDESYRNLKSILKDIKKPTIVFFFGDHLTFLGKGEDIYQKSGFEITDDLKKHTTPLAVWSNYQTKFEMPKYISPSFLSLEILEVANITPKNQFAYLNSISESDTVICQKIPTKLSPKQIKNYELIQYDLIFGKQYILQ